MVDWLSFLIFAGLFYVIGLFLSILFHDREFTDKWVKRLLLTSLKGY